jgi:hypothetical protein
VAPAPGTGGDWCDTAAPAPVRGWELLFHRLVLKEELGDRSQGVSPPWEVQGRQS